MLTKPSLQAFFWSPSIGRKFIPISEVCCEHNNALQISGNPSDFLHLLINYLFIYLFTFKKVMQTLHGDAVRMSACIASSQRPRVPDLNAEFTVVQQGLDARQAFSSVWCVSTSSSSGDDHTTFHQATRFFWYLNSQLEQKLLLIVSGSLWISARLNKPWIQQLCRLYVFNLSSWLCYLSEFTELTSRRANRNSVLALLQMGKYGLSPVL